MAHGWAVGNARGDGAVSFVSLTELRAYALTIPALAIGSQTTNLVIHFEGRLLQSDSLNPPNWQPVPGAFLSPYLPPPAPTQRFFRAVSP